MNKALILSMTLFFLVACDDNSDNGSPKNEKVEEVQGIAASGEWQITFFQDSDADETTNFTGYIFRFAADDILMASNSSNDYAGTWSVVHDGTNDDDNGDEYDDIDFNIAFAAPPDFAELTEDWEIISVSASKIELRHESGGNGGTDLLTFEKL